MKENFQLVIESIHLPGGPDRDNVGDRNGVVIWLH